MEFDVSRFIELINQGRIPGLPEDFTHLQDIAILPGEEIRWVGEVSTDLSVFGPGVGGKYGAIEVLLGVSAYRIALFMETGIIKSKYHFRSFWYKVDFGEEVLLWAELGYSIDDISGLLARIYKEQRGGGPLVEQDRKERRERLLGTLLRLKADEAQPDYLRQLSESTLNKIKNL